MSDFSRLHCLLYFGYAIDNMSWDSSEAGLPVSNSNATVAILVFNSTFIGFFAVMELTMNFLMLNGLVKLSSGARFLIRCGLFVSETFELV